ncbi:MAG TPA: phosphotransferase [Solirubrobacteraceae bacterium]|nr:phosphotransferase [Solirubrobacteraceae bacterium]
MIARHVTGDEVETPLLGGFTNAGLTSRVGDTVRRPLRPTSPATKALLDHLERVGFDGAPRYLGVDDRGREVLSYIPGQAPIAPAPAWALTDAALVSVAELLRGYHEAVASFAPRGHRWPDRVPAQFRTGIVSHNDPNLDNVIFDGERAVALIDFDLAGPGSAEWDLACCGRLWAPLREPDDCPPGLADRSLERLVLFTDAYGATPAQRARLADALLHAHAWCYRVVREAVSAGHETFRRYWVAGGEQRAERTRRWLAAHDGEIRAALGVR